MNEKVVTMSIKELDRLKLVEHILCKRVTQVEAAKQLKLSRRQVIRLCQAYRAHGEAALISKRRGKPSNHRINEAVRTEVIQLIQSHYHDFGPTLAHEKLQALHGVAISRESVRKLMMDTGLWKGKVRKQIRSPQQMRTRRPCFGELIQIDGSPHDWFEGRGPYCCLIVFIDDATSKLITLRFVEAECTQGYFDCLYEHIHQYGRPLAYYSDRHSIFRVNISEAKDSSGHTQFSRACAELGIELVCANSPQAKGRVERANGTLQDRLIKELRLAKINSIDAANAYLPTFIKQYNQRFAKAPLCDEDAHRKTLPNPPVLKQILSHQSTRKLSKQLELSYHNVIYQIQTNTPSYSMRGATVIICEHQGELAIYYKGKSLPFKRFDKNNKPTPILNNKDLNQYLKTKKQNKPAANHPWRGKYATASGDISTLH